MALLFFDLVFVHFYWSIWIVSAYWIISTSVALNWVVSLSRWWPSLNNVFFINLVWNVWVSLFLALFFLLHQVLHSLLNLSASVTDIFHANFYFLLTDWALSFPWTFHFFFRLSAVNSLTNAVNWVVAVHSNSTFGNIVGNINIWIVSRKLTNLRFRLIMLIYWWSSHEGVFQIVLVDVLTSFWTQNWWYFISS